MCLACHLCPTPQRNQARYARSVIPRKKVVAIPLSHVQLFGLLLLEESIGLSASLLDDIRSYSRPW